MKVGKEGISGDGKIKIKFKKMKKKRKWESEHLLRTDNVCARHGTRHVTVMLSLNLHGHAGSV